MKKYLKSIAKSMKTIEESQALTVEILEESLVTQKRNQALNQENLSYYREANRIMFMRFELEHRPFVSVLEGLLRLIPVERITDEKSQEVVDEAKKMIRLMKPAQEKQ